MKRGFTLVELLVYMAILGFIIVVAGRAYSDATGMRVRTQSMTKATEEANRIAEIIKEDLSQMGAKVWYNENPLAGDSPFKIEEHAYMGNTAPLTDISSFNLWHNAGGDKIEFKKISYDGDGKYVGTHLITWYVSNDTLYRRCKTEYGTGTYACPASAEGGEPVIMAENVKAFTLNPSKPLGSSSSAAGFTLIVPNAGSKGSGYDYVVMPAPIPGTGLTPTAFSLGGFSRNLTKTERKYNQVLVGDPGTGNSCKEFDFKKGETYAIKFKTPYPTQEGEPEMITLFNPEIDHMSVGFKGAVGANLPNDFTFYPPQDDKNNAADNISQYFEFSVPSDVGNVCVAFTFAFYSGDAAIGPHKGTLIIKDFELLRKNDGAYEFVRESKDPNYAAESGGGATIENLDNKKNVKAFELVLEVQKGKEAGSTCKHKDGSGNCVGYIIPVPNNGVVPQQ